MYPSPPQKKKKEKEKEKRRDYYRNDPMSSCRKKGINSGGQRQNETFFHFCRWMHIQDEEDPKGIPDGCQTHTQIHFRFSS